ncbi:MAG: hypothetical protein WC757_04435 [Candidatus Paceibacterota bacterium]|jgi:hypothetical protein
MKKVLMLSSVLAYALPMVAGAQIAQDVSSIDGLVDMVKNAIGVIVPLLISLAVLFFLWGVFQYIRGDAAAKAEGAKNMIWGIVGIFVMVSVWGLVGVLSGTFGLNNDAADVEIQLPGIN